MAALLLRELTLCEQPVYVQHRPAQPTLALCASACMHISHTNNTYSGKQKHLSSGKKNTPTANQAQQGILSQAQPMLLVCRV